MTADLQQDRESTVFNSPLICLFVAITLFIALLFRRNDLALLAILVLLLMGISKAWSVMSLPRISCTIRVDRDRLFPGETLTLTTIVKNNKLLPVWVHIRWPRTRTMSIRDDKPMPPQEAGLLWYQQTRFNQEFAALKRGFYQMGPSHLRTSDVFGFFKSQKQLNETLQVIVYPKIVPLKPFLLPKRDLFGTPGDQSPVKDPVYIIGTRDYQPSRPSRHIHWKASARRLRLQEKIFEPSEHGSVMVALDVDAFENEQTEDAFESTLEVIASLCLRLDQMNFAVGFLTNGTTQGGEFSSLPPGRGSRPLAAILEMLGRLQMKCKTRMASALQTIHGQRRGIPYAYFCYEYGRESDAIRKFFNKSAIPVSVFAWRIYPAAPGVRHPQSPGMHLIKDIRLQDEDQA